MSSAVILHPLYSDVGGAEKVALEVARALVKEGWHVRWLTPRPVPKISERLKLLGGLPSSVKMVYVDTPFISKVLPGKRLHALSLYRHLLSLVHEYGNLVIDTKSDMPIPVDIVYIHYPMILGWKKRNPLYERLVTWMYQRIRGEPRLLLTNSRWTADIISRTYGMNAHVLYPPVDTDIFGKALNINSTRERIVVTASRLDPAKRLERLVDVAIRLPNYTFVIIGLTTQRSRQALELIEQRKRKLRADNVEVRMDFSHYDLMKLYATARFYLHPEFPEPFGIAVVEAMAAGLVPIVYRDGGAWTDIVSQLDERLGYTRIVEAANIIREIEKREEWSRLSMRAHQYSSQFSTSLFHKRFLSYFHQLLKQLKLG